MSETISKRIEFLKQEREKFLATANVTIGEFNGRIAELESLLETKDSSSSGAPTSTESPSPSAPSAAPVPPKAGTSPSRPKGPAASQPVA